MTQPTPVEAVTLGLLDLIESDAPQIELDQQVYLIHLAIEQTPEKERPAAIASIHNRITRTQHASAICSMLDIPQPERDGDETSELLDSVIVELLDSIDSMDGLERDDAIATLMSNVALTDGFQFERLRTAVLKKKLMRAKTFDDEIAKRRFDLEHQDATDGAQEERPVTWPYRIEGGRIVYLFYRSGPDGTKLESTPVADFTAAIKEEITDEDGRKTFVVKGNAVRGGGFEFEMDAEEFGNEGRLKATLDAASGAKDPVRAGMKKHLSAAIQLLTANDIPKIKRYRRTGWADGIFLIPGREPPNVLIEPPEKLVYRIDPDADLDKGLECLDSLILSLDAERTTVVLSLMFQAPAALIAGWRGKRYAPFICGRSGSFKTSFAMVAMSMYGPKFNDESILIKWGEGATRTSVMLHAAFAHDLPLLIDNYKPSTGEGARAFINLIHNIVEGGDKDRAKRSGTELQRTKKVFCFPICTGEDIPDTDPASLARILSIPVRWQQGEDNPELTHAQSLSNHLCAVGGAWLSWLESEDGQEIVKNVGAQFEEYRTKWSKKLGALRRDMVNPMRVATNLATNELTWQMVCHHPTIGPIAQKFSQAHQEGLSEIIAVAMSEATAEALEARRFLSALQELLTAGQVILAPKDDVAMTEADRNRLDYMRDRRIGWQDKDTLYLLPKLARNRVEQLLGKDGLGNISNTSLYKQLDEIKVLQQRGARSTTAVVRIEGKGQRVLCIKADAVSITLFDQKSVTEETSEEPTGDEIGQNIPF